MLPLTFWRIVWIATDARRATGTPSGFEVTTHGGRQSAGLDATFHFTFTGHEQRQATVVIKDQKICVEDGHVGKPDLHVTADSQTWIGFLRKEKNVVWALLQRKIRLDGPLKLLVAFGKCFPM